MKRSALQQKTPLLRKTPLARTSSLSRNTAPKAPRQRKCSVKTCRAPFTPRNMAHKACSPECALALVELDKAKAARKERQEAKQKLKRRADYVREAQAAVNAYVRTRDESLPCISCGRWHDGQWHAGHFLSTGARPGLRFDERNIHKQCMPCNVHLSGNLVNYRIALIRKIGLAAVEALEADDTPRKHSVEELVAIRDEYRQRLRALRHKKRNNDNESI